MSTKSKQRTRGARPRALGTNPRATGANPRARAAANGDTPAPRARKNMRLDQALLDEAREALGVADETEAVTIALQRVVNNRRVAEGIRALGGRRAVDASRLDD